MARNKRYPKRYREYRGRRRRGNLVLKLIIGLLVLILLAFLIFTLVLGGGVEYTDEGVRLILPWRENTGEEPGGNETPSGDKPPVFIIEDPEEEPDESQSGSQVPTAPEKIGAVEVSVSQLVSDGAADVAQAGGNTLVVTMKGSGGKADWYSETAWAGLTPEEGAAVAEAVSALDREGELHLVARVVCFRDPELAAQHIGGPLRTQGGNMWYDSRGLRWVSPASAEAREYLIRLCLELADMGFDEILLECAGYPYFGEVHVLATDELRPEDRSAPVETFLREVKAALAERGVLMSLLVTQDMAVGADDNSGITPELLARYADRVWVGPLEGVNYAEIAATAPFAGRIVLLNGDPGQGSWADIYGISK